MVQIKFVPDMSATTSTVGATPTTGEGIRLPYWAPEIAFLPATTTIVWMPVIRALTTSADLNMGVGRRAKVGGWKRDSTGNQFVIFTREVGPETEITLSYRAAGELVRT